ncbi:MAG: UvrD-helicase domain-containing protein [Bacteroidales bacterium]|nr:UvrD-helicase domain-containing protein [Bacteroidales bacterium]
MIELITASAGSGKTYTLAKKYIEILLRAYLKNGSRDTGEFEHILAVTFTNKATAEMKDRILQELYILSQNPVLSDYYTEFCGSYDRKTVSDPGTWKNILFTLLHNYSRFSVSTIDTFFQSVLRHFAREIGEFNSYRIELDRDSLVSEAADNLLSGITSDNDPVFKVVSALTGEKMADGKKFSPKRELTDIAKALMGGDFLRVFEGLNRDSAYSELIEEIKHGEPKFTKRVNDLEKALRTDAQKAAAESVELAGSLLDAIDGYNTEKSNYVKKNVRDGVASYRETGKRFSDPCLLALKGDGDKLFAKNAPDKDRFLARNSALMDRLVSSYARKKRICELLKYIPHLKFTVSVFKAFAQVTDSANVKCLEDTTKILSEIIAGSDAPFIYEKIGTRFDHYLLDEFQDTSHVQWENFKPLLADANSKGGRNLVVGDVKQSIYRFRNSDYTILDREVPEDFAAYIGKTPLNSNFRSGRNIVEFNNDLFAALAREVDSKMAGAGNVLKDIYLHRDEKGEYELPHTVGQIAKKDFDGFVHYESICCEDTVELENKIYPEVVSIVKDLCARGVMKKDILILVKGKEQGSRIAEDLLREEIGVYSDDSLFVSSNAIARRLLAVLRYMDNGKDQISKAIVDTLGENFLEEGETIAYSTLVELCEKVIAKLKALYCTTPDGGKEFSGSIPYLSSLVDIASGYETDYGNSLHAFLEYIGRKDARIASSASDEAVRIMTIHKSKGLDGEFVIVPFANKAVLFDTHHNQRWAACDEVPLPDGSRDFVYYASLSKSNADSAFSGTYAEEYKLRCIDAMNLLYVAFTRARHGLYILEGKTKRQDENLAAIATQYLVDRNDGHLVSSDDTGMVYELGDLAAAVTDYLAPKVESNSEKRKLLDDLHRQERLPGDYSVFESRACVRNSVKAGEFFDGLRPNGEQCVSDSRLKGVLQHSILSAVHTLEDVDAAVEAKWQEGVLEGTKEDAKAYLKARINAVSKYGWYDPDAAIVTEEGMLVKTSRLQKNGDGTEETPVASRILPDGEKEYIVCRRPDRIVVRSDGTVDIVDYKFTGSADANLSKYRRQVLAYCDWYRALPGCGDKKVTGYIWYVNADKVHVA